jgi:HD-GYP domain-containing protein (c-di-GMP phosphodiesterase class II)
MAILIHDLLVGFSRAIDSFNPQFENRSVRRAYLALKIAQQQGLSSEIQKRLFIAALMRDLPKIVSEKNSTFWYEEIKKYSCFQDLAELISPISSASQYSSECMLLNLVDHILNLFNEKPAPLSFYQEIITEVFSITPNPYSLVDLLALREISHTYYFWRQVFGDNNSEPLREASPFGMEYLESSALIQISDLFAKVIDLHCGSIDGYSKAVGEKCAEIAKLYGFSKTGILELDVAGKLHELGKLSVPKALLTKFEPLSETERMRIKTHTKITWGILSTIPGMHDIACSAAYHQERIDGKGYPFNLQGSQLALGPRIVSVVNKFTTLHQKNKCKQSLSIQKCEDILKCNAQDGSIDQTIVEIIIDMVKTQSSTKYLSN